MASTYSTTKAEVKPWVIPPEQRAKIERLNVTSAWLRNPPDPESLRQYRGKWVAARDCQIISAADTYAELRKLLENEEAGSYMVVCFRGGRITCEPT
jgi:hypothetical protein